MNFTINLVKTLVHSVSRGTMTHVHVYMYILGRYSHIKLTGAIVML